jgi:hypothetical protein
MKSKKIYPRITILPIGSIHPHEEFDPSLLSSITNSLKLEGVVHDPLLVSTRGSVIMDGTHRFWALNRLGCCSVPVALYEYSSEAVQIGCWYRCVDEVPTFEASNVLRVVKSSVTEGLAAVSGRSALLSIVYRDFSQIIFADHFDIHQSYVLLSFMECGLKGMGHRITYATEEDALSQLKTGKISTILAPPPITKEEIMATASNGRTFPLKSSRHIISSRPIHINVPLAWLYEEAAEADKKLQKLLLKGFFRSIPRGSLIDGRRYEEEVYIFEMYPSDGGEALGH